MEDIRVVSGTQKSPAEYFQTALNAVKEIMGVDASPDQEARLLIQAGKACDLSGDWDQSLETYQRALELCESDESRAEALKRTGHIKSKRSEWEAASEVYEASLQLLSKLGNLREIGNVYKDVGHDYFELGDMARSEKHYEKALKIAQQCDDTQLVADVQNNLGILSNVRGQTDEAVTYYQQSITGYEAINDDHGLAQVYHNLAMTCVDKEEWKLAGENYQRSMEICMELGDIDFLSIIYTNRAHLALHLHDPYVAKSYCDGAFGIFDKTGNKAGIAEAHKLYGTIYSNMREWDSSERSFQKGTEICEEYSNQLTAAEIYYESGSMSRKRRKNEAALYYLQKALAIYKALRIDRKVSKISAEIRALAP